MEDEKSEIQPVLPFVNLNLADPLLIAVIKPELLIVAIVGSSLIQDPPEAGVIVVVVPIQSSDGPVIIGCGFGLTNSSPEATDRQPVALSVNLNVEVPALRAVTSPELVIDATDELVLVQVPPEEGLSDVLPPIHNVETPE